MDTDVLSAVKEKIKTLNDTYQITVTDQAVLIMGECFTAILVDPYPTWPTKGSSQQLRRFYLDMLNSLPGTLANFGMERN